MADMPVLPNSPERGKWGSRVKLRALMLCVMNYKSFSTTFGKNEGSWYKTVRGNQQYLGFSRVAENYAKSRSSHGTSWSFLLYNQTFVFVSVSAPVSEKVHRQFSSNKAAHQGVQAAYIWQNSLSVQWFSYTLPPKWTLDACHFISLWYNQLKAASDDNEGWSCENRTEQGDEKLEYYSWFPAFFLILRNLFNLADPHCTLCEVWIMIHAYSTETWEDNYLYI